MGRRTLLIGGSLLSSLFLGWFLDGMGYARPHGESISLLATGGGRLLAPGLTFFGRELPLAFVYVWPVAIFLANLLAWKLLLDRRHRRRPPA